MTSRRATKRRRINLTTKITQGTGEPITMRQLKAQMDQRVVYSLSCCWWDSATAAGRREPTRLVGEYAMPSPGLPCCPFCGSMLMEMESESEWWKGAIRFERQHGPGYVGFLKWVRGKDCRRVVNGKTIRLNFETARAEYDELIKRAAQQAMETP